MRLRPILLSGRRHGRKARDESLPDHIGRDPGRRVLRRGRERRFGDPRGPLWWRGRADQVQHDRKLSLGSSLLVPGANKGGYSNLTINTNTPANSHAEIGAAFGKISIYAAAKFSGIAAKGTFSSLTTGVPFTGSWNCGGPIRKS